MKKHTFYKVFDCLMVVFIATSLCLTSFIGGQMIHESIHLHDITLRQHSADQICYFGVYDLQSFNIMKPFIVGWVVEQDYSYPHIPLDEVRPYKYQAITTIAFLLISLFTLLRLKYLMEHSSRQLVLAGDSN